MKETRLYDVLGVSPDADATVVCSCCYDQEESEANILHVVDQKGLSKISSPASPGQKPREPRL